MNPVYRWNKKAARAIGYGERKVFFVNVNDNSHMDEYSNQMLEDMYPEVYHSIYPMIRQKAIQMRGQNVNMQMLDSMVNDIMWDSGMMDMASPDVIMDPDEAYMVPAARFGYGGYRPRARPFSRRRGFFPNDFVRILLLRELLGR